MLTTSKVLSLASLHLKQLSGQAFDVLSVAKPASPDAAVNLAKVISKLSPLVGNLIEFNSAEHLNLQDEFKGLGRWKRQDPGFPDTIFEGDIHPTPGFEIKAWFPLATEITARFKDSQDHFKDDRTHVALLAWLPEYLIYGKPKIVDVCVVSGQSVAAARDSHYHNPPDYLVLEPEDTSGRTANLQQTNTNGYKFQGTGSEMQKAWAFVKSWGPTGKNYSTSKEYQHKLRELAGRYKYRLDTNFAKIDRIEHPEIEAFKDRVLKTTFVGHQIGQWARFLGAEDETRLRIVLEKHLGIKA